MPEPRRHAVAPDAPSADQLAATRASHWHQDDKPLLTVEALREWITRCGLVAYGLKVQQLGSPAPSLVEATLGKKLEAAAELSEGDAARSLLARLVADGAAVPLNLLGATGGIGTDVPDYVCSAAVFSFLFTLRGNKAWKLAPVTSGAVKVSPLALAAYEMLASKGSLSAYDLATQLGKEVTEGAVLRSLTELWGQLRVLPLAEPDGGATVWELASARFTKQIKAGANAGQPTALSALISLYLRQAVAATEGEIETFLSPLAPRSRVREVIHALLGARQLETLVVEGKTLLHVSGELPGFAAAAVAEGEDETAVDASGAPAEGSRIRKFAGKPGGKIGTGLRSKPALGSKPAFGSKPGFGSKPAFGARSGSDSRERRPFKRASVSREEAAERPRFDRPWSEKPPLVPRDAPWDAPRDAPSDESTLGVEVEAAGEAAASPRKEFKPREFKSREGATGPRKTFSKPGTFGRKREGAGERPAFGRGRSAGESSSAGDGRAPRRDFGAARPPRREASGEGPRGEFGGGERGAGAPFQRAGGSFKPAGAPFKRTGDGAGSYAPRPRTEFGSKPAPRPDRTASSEGETPRKTFRKFDAPREKKQFGAGKSPGAKPFGAKPFAAKPFGAKPFGSRPAGERSGPDRPTRTFDRAGGPESPRESASRPRSSEGRPGSGAKRAPSDRPPAGDRAGGLGRRPPSKGAGGFKGAGGPFAKFADGKKPFRKPGPGARPAKKTAGGGGRTEGGYRPTKRRPE